MTTVNANGEISVEVFVAGGSIIYKLSANLSQLMNVTVSNNTVVSVRGLSASNGGQYIVACLTTGSCIGYDVISLTSTMSNVPLNEPGAEAAIGNDPVAIFPGQAEGIVYTGTAIDFGTPSVYRISLGRYAILEESIMTNRTRDYTLQRSGRFNARVFKAGFSIDNFAYYTVEDDTQRIRILRVCNESVDDMFKALFEVQLTCGSVALFAAVSLLEDFPNTNTNTLVLAVRPPSASGSGRVCTYSMSDINDAMDDGLTACRNNDENREVAQDEFHSNFVVICDSAIITVSFAVVNLYINIVYFPQLCDLDLGAGFDLMAIRGDDVSSPLVIGKTDDQFKQFTSSVIVQVEGELLMFIGTGNGELLKVATQ